MKKTSLISAIVLLATTGSFAQKQPGPLPYNKEHLDSLFSTLPKLNLPFAVPVPKGYVPPYVSSKNDKSFESANPGAVVINRTPKGIIYNMPLDNMAVLVPYISGMERMPVSDPSFKTAPNNKMPNPLYRGKRPPAEIK
jgi:hypothetical protein